MGTIHHIAVIATTSIEHEIERINKWIASLTPHEANHFIKSKPLTNGYVTIVLVPDGSKEGWDESDKGDELRTKFIIELCDSQFDDGSSNWDWIEIGYGEYGYSIKKYDRNA